MKMDIDKKADRKGSEDLEDMLTQAWSIFTKNIHNLVISGTHSYTPEGVWISLLIRYIISIIKLIILSKDQAFGII